MTRYHFVAGLPKAGARRFAALLAQNPRFSVASDSPAEQIFNVLNDAAQDRDRPLSDAGAPVQDALLRGALDAIHHTRPIDAVVFDNNPNWLFHIAQLATLFPLSRFVILVRDPARIAAEMADEAQGAQSPQALMSPQGVIGAPIEALQRVLSGPAASRVLLLDYDRMLSDPSYVLRAVYGFLSEDAFEHDFKGLPTVGEAPDFEKMKLPRRAFAIGLKGKSASPTNLPIWRRNQNSAATMILPEAG